MYRNCWVTAWTTDWSPGERTRSAWEPGWRQFSCVTGRGGACLHLSLTPFKGWLPLSLVRDPPLVKLSPTNLESSDTGKQSSFLIAPFYCAEPSIIIPLVKYLFHYTDLSNCYTQIQDRNSNTVFYGSKLKNKVSWENRNFITRIQIEACCPVLYTGSRNNHRLNKSSEDEY